MKDESALRDLMARGAEADAWLNNPCFRSVIQEIKADLISEFEKTRTAEAATREEIWRKIQMLNAIVTRIERHSRNGRQASSTLIEKLREKIAGR